MSADPRMEKNALGTVTVTGDRFWGAQTQRCLDCFKIGYERMPFALLSFLRQCWSGGKILAANIRRHQRLAGLDPQPTLGILTILLLTLAVWATAAVGNRVTITRRHALPDEKYDAL